MGGIVNRAVNKNSHTFLLIYKKDPTYLWSVEQREWGMSVLVLKKCIHCDFSLTPPQGSPWQICHVCWGNMIQHAEPGIIWGESKTFFTCECCGHTTFK